MLPRAAPEVLEGPLVGFEKRRELLIGRRPIKTPPTEPERQHKEVNGTSPRAKLDFRLPPVDLALLAWRGLEATLRHLGCSR